MQDVKALDMNTLPPGSRSQLHDISIILRHGVSKGRDMLPELDRISTIVAFVAVIAVGVIGLDVMPIGMTRETILMMVLPSMVVFGAIMLVIGMAHGQTRRDR